MFKRKILLLIGISAIILCSCSKSEIDLTKHEVPIKNMTIKWGMNEHDLLKEFATDLIYEVTEINDGITVKKTITIKQEVQTDYGVSKETVFSFDNTSGIFSNKSDKTIGLYQVEFDLNKTAREDLKKMVFHDYGEMNPVTDEWKGNIGVEIPIEFYIPVGAKITDLNEKSQEDIKKFLIFNLQDKYDELSLEKEVSKIMAHEDILKIIVMGKSEDNSSGLILKAYYLIVLENN